MLRITIVTLGQNGHGKTTLLSALTRVLAQMNNANRYLTVEQLEDTAEVRGFGLSLVIQRKFEERYGPNPLPQSPNPPFQKQFQSKLSSR